MTDRGDRREGPGGSGPADDGVLAETVDVADRSLAETADVEETAPWFDADGANPWRLSRGQTVGRYVVLDRLGSGGMAVVYAAWDPELDRKVALKLLRPADRGADSAAAEEGRLRLMREAQAMARLAHPNVVTVHDVGSFGDGVFVAIELVPGGDLDGLLRVRRHSWREILGLFSTAGRGLAAAHAAGLVHRDFKPANVLIGEDGRVRVADFGLARASGPGLPGQVGAGPSSAPDGIGPRGSSGALAAGVTRHGAILGTPAYMAPEQFLGGEADARSDQYSFCAALWEALYGALPFRGESVADIFAAIMRGEPSPEPPGSKVPGWLRRALLRGLSKEPERRYPDMAALLAELARDRGARWRRFGIAAAALLALGAGALGYARSERTAAAVCDSAAGELGGVWDQQAKSRMRAAFLATDKPYAADAFDKVSVFLDDYADEWRAARRTACEESLKAGAAGVESAARREGCLAARLAQLGALTDLFARADALTVEKAVEATRALASVADCAYPAQLESGTTLPADPGTRAAVVSIRERLARGRALADLYKTEEALALAQAAVEEARELGFAPVLGEALVLLGTAEMHTGIFAEADRDLADALYEALAAGDDRTAAQAAILLVEIEGPHLGRFEAARIRAREAAAILDRSGNDSAGSWELERALGWLEESAGSYGPAAERMERSLALIERAGRGDTLEAARIRADIGSVLTMIGQHERALPYLARAVSDWEREVGADHPQTAAFLAILALGQSHVGLVEDALAGFERAENVTARALGPEHPNLIRMFTNHGELCALTGRFDEGIALTTRAAEIAAEVYGGSSLNLVRPLRFLGDALWRKGDSTRALEVLERALAIAEAAGGSAHLEVATVCFYLGRALVAAGRTADAVRVQRRTTEVGGAALGPAHPMVGYAHAGLGEALLADGDAAGAIPELELAAEMFDKGGIDALELARSRLNLARALGEAGRDPARVRALAGQARDGFVAVRDRGRTDLAQAAGFIAAHAGP